MTLCEVLFPGTIWYTMGRVGSTRCVADFVVPAQRSGDEKQLRHPMAMQSQSSYSSGSARGACILILATFWGWTAAHAEVDYITEIHPVLAERCYQCHAGDSAKGGLQLDTREGILAGGKSGPAAVEGDAAASHLIERVLTRDEFDRMPPDGPRLTDAQVAALSSWIDAGMPWGDVSHLEQAPEYIAPLNLRDVKPPVEGFDDLREHPVDRFLAEYLESQGIAQPESVNDARFARRAYLDVIGLLPTPEQLQTFLADENPDKRERLIDTLLANDRAYAEHWMSFWNDLLRNDFVGTGYIDGGRAQITNWLFSALERNKPYDEFVEELIDPRPASEGFVKGIVWRGETAVVHTPPMQAARNVSQVFMGVNLKCASCHDSFVDHWKLQDAYDLANAFSPEPMPMVRCDTPTGDMAGYKFLWPDLGTIDGTESLEERRKQIATLVTKPENGPFTRTIVNRLWAQFMGFGLVEPIDNIEGKAWHPELLDWLAHDLIDNGYDLKHTMRRILTSAAYHWQSQPAPPKDKPIEEYVFAGPHVRRMSAEQFYDALAAITGVWQNGPRYLFPEDHKRKAEAVEAAKAAGKSDEEAQQVPVDFPGVRAWRVPADALMTALGRTNREQVTTRRLSESTTLQALELSNGAVLARYLERASANLVEDAEESPKELIDELFVHALQREPVEPEFQLAGGLLQSGAPREGLEDLLWTIAMLPEFQLIY